MLSCFPKKKIMIPKHLAVISDGNWSIDNTIVWCLDKGIREFSLLTHKAGPQTDSMIDEWLNKEQTDVAFDFVSTSEICPLLWQKMYALKSNSRNNVRLKVYIYVSYVFAEDVKQCLDKFDYKVFSVIPSSVSCPELLIRTGGRRAIGNFCLWHLRCAELMFIKVPFCDCTAETWDQCLDEFSTRKHRII